VRLTFFFSPLSCTAILNVTKSDDGGIAAKGWKWERGSWKDGCDYDFGGDVVKGVFRSADKRKNPDTLERDGAMLIVNKMDDVFGRQTPRPDRRRRAEMPTVLFQFFHRAAVSGQGFTRHQ
jgi:hypothetical protein